MATKQNKLVPVFPKTLKLLPGGKGTIGRPYVIMAVPVRKNARAVAWVYDSKPLAKEIVRRYNELPAMAFVLGEEHLCLEKSNQA